MISDSLKSGVLKVLEVPVELGASANRGGSARLQPGLGVDLTALPPRGLAQ